MAAYLYLSVRPALLLFPRTGISTVSRRCATTLQSLKENFKGSKQRGQRGRNVKNRGRPPRRFADYKPLEVNQNSDWPSVYQAARPYDPYMIPLAIRMGVPAPGELPPKALGNVELLKLTNFFHLTPPAIEKHCKALKPLCTPWSEDLSEYKMTVVTQNFVFPAPSLRHYGSRIVKVTVRVSDINFRDEYAKKKFILLANEYYSKSSDSLVLSSDKCPTRKQNREYLMYLLKVLYLESHKIDLHEKEELDKVCSVIETDSS